MSKFNKIKNEDNKQKKTIKIDRIIQPKFNIDTRDKTSIKGWRDAVYKAERAIPEDSDYSTLQGFYREIADNAIVHSALRLRVSKIMEKEFNIVKNDTIVDNDLFQQKWFADYVTYMIESEVFGYTCIELGDLLDIDNVEKTKLSDIGSVNRLYCNPKMDFIKAKQSYGKIDVKDGAVVTDPKYTNTYFFVKNDIDRNYLGVFHKVMPYYQRLKDAESAYSNYLDKYGVAPVIIKTNNNNPESNHNKAEFLKSLSSNSYGIIDMDDELVTLDVADSNSEAFLECIDHNKKMILKLLVGVETLGAEQSYVGSSEVNERLLDSIVKNDEFLITDTINNILIPKFINRGVNWLTDCKIEFKQADNIDYEQKLREVEVLSNAGYQIDTEYLSELFDMPIVKAIIQENNNNKKDGDTL